MDIDQPITSTSPQETARLGQKFGNYVREKGIRIVCLYGGLGSGKTTFSQGFAKAFGITTRLLSPTFFIVRRYSPPKSLGYLYHIDLYRISGERELTHLGIPEILADPDSIVLFEWAEKMGVLLPQTRIDVYFEVLEEGKHKIWIKK